MDGVHAVVEGDEAAAHAGEHDVCKPSGLDVVSAETTEVLTEYQIDFPSFGVGDHLVEHGPVESCPGDPVIAIGGVEVPVLYRPPGKPLEPQGFGGFLMSFSERFPLFFPLLAYPEMYCVKGGFTTQIHIG